MVCERVWAFERRSTRCGRPSGDGRRAAARSETREVTGRSVAQPEDRLVQGLDESRTVAVQEGLDESASNGVGFRISCEPILQLGSRPGSLAEQDRAAHGCGPEPIGAA